MELLIGIAARVVLLVAAWKLWRWSSGVAARVRWRRRISLLLFLWPMVLWGLGLVLPEAFQGPLGALGQVQAGIDWVLARLLGLTAEVGGLLGAALRPLCYAAVYGGLGFLIGWPLDRRSARRAEEEPPAKA